MEKIETCAEISIRRALAFTTLGIGTVMIGLISEPHVAFRAGGLLLAITAVVLFYKGHSAPTRDYRQTEVWLLLDRRHPLPEDRLQAAIGGILRRLYWRYGRITIAVATAFWFLGLLALVIV